MYLTDIMTVGANLVGNPAVSIPAGADNGLPIGLQLMAPSGADRELLGLAQKTEELLR
jgi:aspartyl-tRNA(Asn)/glutamyl-tRNA(Gln) amidotransferase subunit A